ncbi:hemolysin family protein [Haladaptatus sp. DJG-WS-42]|uniref:hemolysin family protein n=1 Tax=Haladaptatus sp. DJG-WS-42 TaxID=3120516 RepID=UPI0030CECEDA
MVVITALTLAGLLAIVVLVLASAFFSSAEIAIFSLEDHKFEVEGGESPGDEDTRIHTLNRLRDNPHRLLVTILVGNNVVNIATASVATGLLVTMLPSGSAITVSTILVSFVVLVFGEITPKSYAIANAESWSLRVSRPLATLQKLLYPIVVSFELLTSAIAALVGGSTEYESPAVTREEITALVRSAGRAGVLDRDEQQMIQRIFRFSSITAREVMVPRVEVLSVPLDTSCADVVSFCATERVTRVPVYTDTIDHITGYVDLRDVVGNQDENTPLSTFVRPVLHVFEAREIDEVLTDLQDERLELAVVIDEFGTTAGLLTAEDIVEEIVGEIFDADEEQAIATLHRGSVTARGDAKIEDVNRALDAHLPAEDGLETIAAFIYNELGRPAESGEVLTYDGLRVTVGAVENNRILRVRVERVTTDTANTTTPE